MLFEFEVDFASEANNFCLFVGFKMATVKQIRALIWRESNQIEDFGASFIFITNCVSNWNYLFFDRFIKIDSREVVFESGWNGHKSSKTHAFRLNYDQIKNVFWEDLTISKWEHHASNKSIKTFSFIFAKKIKNQF